VPTNNENLRGIEGYRNVLRNEKGINDTRFLMPFLLLLP